MKRTRVLLGTLALLVSGCAQKKMQASATVVAAAVDDLRADVEVQQLVRTELARTGAERLARGEAELAVHEATRAALRPQLSKSAEPLLRHSQAVSQGADHRFAPTVASEVERRATGVEYGAAVGELEALRALLEALAERSRRSEISRYLELGAAAAKAAKDAWTEAKD